MKTRESIVALDKRYVWHPYTPMGTYIDETNPLVIERASGSRFYDVDGKSFIDANSSWWCAVLGHDHPRLVAALQEQLRSMPHVPLAGITHGPAAELARALVQSAGGGISRVFFSDDGSTAVEVALKLSLQYWHQNGRPERTRFLALDRAFHGETLGATALGGVAVFRRPFASVVLDCIHVSPEADGVARAFSSLEAAIEQDSEGIAAVVLEPIVQGAAGMRTYDPAFLTAARELTRKHDIFLVLDEVFTGFGRTGPFWAKDHAGIEPDLICTSKALSGGLFPFAATLTSQRIFDGFLGAAERAFFHGHTFSGNPLGARVALEVLRVFEDEQIIENAKPKAARIASEFSKMAGLFGVLRTRSLGMIGALDLMGGEGYLEQGGQRVYAEALSRGAYLRPLGNTIYIAPPLNISNSDLDELLVIVSDSVRAALSASSLDSSRAGDHAR